jgi:hypothetical protein
MDRDTIYIYFRLSLIWLAAVTGVLVFALVQ